MNSYPIELLAQLAPVMFVAGLDVPEVPPKTQDPFYVLTLRLRDALLAQRKPAIWAEKSKAFQTILVDKQVKFPPRKLEETTAQKAHSPLSPLTPSSPLFPDGLIAPIWIRKHTTLVPSVFVLFMRIFEYTPGNPLGSDSEREQEERKRDSELAAEIAMRKKTTNERSIKLTVVLMASRKMLDDPTLEPRLTFIRRQSGLDSRAALFVLTPVSPAELSDFVKSLQDALYEPAVDYYTAHSKRVRRKRNQHSQTHPINNNPVSPTHGAMIRPLRPEGWTVRYEYKMACFAEFRGEDEVALKHYQDAYAMLGIMFGSTAILPPRTKRWAEAKVLADCINVKVCKLYLYNNEHALALAHHTTHMRRFGDFSRGWGIGEETFEYWSWMARQHRILAELLDQGSRASLVIPVHRPAPPVAPSTTTTTTRRAGESFETEALRAFGINPSHALQHPGFYFYMAAKCTEMRRDRFVAALEAESPHSGSTPGFANEKKVDHHVIILELYTKAYEIFKKYTLSANEKAATAASAQATSTQGRLTLWIAFRIAQTYYDAGKFDMAVRFFERIAKTYRREQWGFLLKPLLKTWYACAQRLGDVDLSVRLLVEMLGHGPDDLDEPSGLEEDLLAVLKSTVPTSPEEPLVVDLSEAQPIFDSTVMFWSSQVKVNEPTAFQIALTAPADGATISALPFTSLTVHFARESYGSNEGGNGVTTVALSPVVINHAPLDDGDADSVVAVRRVDLGDVSGSLGDTAVAYLRWKPGSTLVLCGTITSEVPTTLIVPKLVLELKEGTWTVEIPFQPSSSRIGVVPISRWLTSIDPPKFMPLKRENLSSVSVVHRPHQLTISLSHQSPAYLNEEYPILINITNADDRPLYLSLDVLLQPSEIDDAINSISMDDEHSSSMIRGISCGLVSPGVTVVKTLHLLNTGGAGDRMLDISIQSRISPTNPAESPADDEVISPTTSTVDMTEHLETLVVPTVDPLVMKFDVSYSRALNSRAGLADLRTFDRNFWDDSLGGEAIISAILECVGPWNLHLESIKLVRQNNNNARVIDCSVDQDEYSFPSEYMPGDQYCDRARVSLAPDEDHDYTSQTIPGPGEYEIRWQRLHSDGKPTPISIHRFALPQLLPPREGLIALLSVPPTAKLHEPISLHLSIRNQHPTRSANITVQLEPDPSDGFVVAGLRSGRVPIMMPGVEEKMVWRLVPIECGYVRLPKIKVVDRRKALASAQGLGGPNAEVSTEGEVVRIVDVRMDRRGDDESEEELGTVLVLPYLA